MEGRTMQAPGPARDQLADDQTTVEIPLPNRLAQEAERAGLLTSESVEKWLREQLKEKRVNDLFAAMDRMAAVKEPAAANEQFTLSPEAIASEMAAMRAERRAHSSR